jgi:hypothetical protein
MGTTKADFGRPLADRKTRLGEYDVGAANHFWNREGARTIPRAEILLIAPKLPCNEAWDEWTSCHNVSQFSASLIASRF